MLLFTRVMNSYDIPVVASLAAESFSENEPICTYLGISQEEFEQWCKDVLDTCCKQSISMVLEDDECNIIGCTICEKFDRFSEVHEFPNHDIQDFYQSVNEQIPHEINYNESLRLILFATRPGYEKLGVCTQLLQDTLSLARDTGCVFAYAIASSDSAQHVLLDKLGFASAYEVLHNSFDQLDELSGKTILAIKSL